MRNISFSITLKAFHDGTKDVTRRGNAKGPTWKNLKPGVHLMAVEKAQGLKKGETVVKIGEIVIVACATEQLRCIVYSRFRDDDTHPGGIRHETSREGFPEMSAPDFVRMFCKFNGCKRDTYVNRIVFRRLP
jgi:hypothetical protein